MQNNQELDRMIDSALDSYSSAPPQAGLETRVLGRVRLVQSTRRNVIGWAVAVALAASVMAVVFLVRVPGTPAPVGHTIAGRESPPPAVVPGVPPMRVMPKHHPGSKPARHSVPSVSLPKLEQFPSPEPLTAEERALRGFVERYPAEARQTFAELRAWNNRPIKIEPIQIAPIHTGAP